MFYFSERDNVRLLHCEAYDDLDDMRDEFLESDVAWVITPYNDVTNVIGGDENQVWDGENLYHVNVDGGVFAPVVPTEYEVQLIKDFETGTGQWEI